MQRIHHPFVGVEATPWINAIHSFLVSQIVRFATTYSGDTQQHLHHLGAKVVTRTCTWSFSLFSQKLKLQPSLSVSSMNFHPSIWRRRSNTMVWKKCKCKAKLLFNFIDMLVHQISSWKGMPQIKRECQSGLLHIRPHSDSTLLRVRPPSWSRARTSIVP